MNYKLLRGLVILLLTMVVVGCKPDEDYSDYRGSAESVGRTAAAVNPTVQAAVKHLYSGDFDSAEAILDTAENGGDIAQLRLLMTQQRLLEEYRVRQRKEAYDEQVAELRRIEAEFAELGDDVEDREQVERDLIEEAMVALIQAREYVVEENKGALLNDPFVMKVIDMMLVRGHQYRQEGKWVDAYAHCYYWLTQLFEEDKDFKETTERLTELAAIDLSLKDSGCGENAAERYEGINPEMLIRALQALETNYVNGVSYEQMVEKVIQRCELLGEALRSGSDELAWTAEGEPVAAWLSGIAVLPERFGSGSQPMRMEQFIQLFEEVVALNKMTLNLPQEVVIAHFTEAALSALDPFTSLVWPWNVKDFEKSMTQQFSGIGVEISKRAGVLKITSLLPDTPAYRSGLDADDEIVAVNGESTAEMTIFCAVSKITGPRGTNVTLTLRRPVTGQTWDVTIARDRIVVQPLRGWRRTETGDWDHFVDPANGIGYVRLTAFTETSGPDMDKTLRELERQGLTALILDLRFNSGGYLSSAAEIVDLFVREGVIVKSNPRHGFATYEIAHRSGTHPDYPLVVLINGSSASASEIVAGALQDARHQRAILVGERSYGKGSVQVVTPFTGGGSQLKYTVAYYHLPSDQQVKSRYQMERLGRTDWGIAPDVEVKMYNNEMRQMVDLQRDNDVLFRADHEEDGQPPVRHSLEETLKSDPQLAVALMAAQAKLIAEGKPLTLTPFEDFDSVAQDNSN